MIIKTLQWNIGGGFIRGREADPTSSDSYKTPALEYIGELIKEYQPDVVTMQETHASGALIQAERLSEITGLTHWVNDEYDNSHLETNQKLGQAVLSRYPIAEHEFEFFHNPKYSIVRPDGKTWATHNKGITRCAINVADTPVEIQTLHMIPFRKFDVDPYGPENQETREDVESKIRVRDYLSILQGDLNLDETSLRRFLPRILDDGFQEVLNDQPTTPKGRRYDHVLFKGFSLKSFEVITEVLTDHYPLLVEFEAG